MREPLPELFSRSVLLILDVQQIPANITRSLNIERYFEELLYKGLDPRLPVYRQKFNNTALTSTGARYIVCRYGEDRSTILADTHIGKQGRTVHMGVDIFSRDLESVHAPCDGVIVRTGYEEGSHSFGHYAILRPTDKSLPYFFFGHLNSDPIALRSVKAGDTIGRLGDFQENGGWSRHLHLQLFRDLPRDDENLVGYLSQADFKTDPARFPDPMPFFPDWHITS